MDHHFELSDSLNQSILYGTIYEPKNVFGVVFFVHDLFEHRFRYEGLARFFNEHHLAFVTYDLRGHHKSLINDDRGHFGDDYGANLLLEDGLKVVEYTMKRFPYAPLLMMGQGFGAYLAQLIVDYFPLSFKQLVLVNPYPIKKMSHLRLKLLSFTTANKPLKRRLYLNRWISSNHKYKGENSYLSHNQKHVLEYELDPFCNFVLTQRAIRDVLEVMLASDRVITDSFHSGLMISLIGGKDNPLIHKGRDLIKLKEKYFQVGYSRIDLSLIEDKKHDLLVEFSDSDELSQLLISLCQQLY